MKIIKRIYTWILLISLMSMIFLPSAAFADDEAVEAEALSNTLTLSVAVKTVNGYSYSVKTDTTVKLRWNEIKGADCYKLQRVDKNGRKIWTKTISSSNRAHTVKNLKAGTSYYFKVYAKKGTSVIAESSILKITTFSKTTGYFYKKTVVDGVWPGILITSKKPSEETVNGFNNLKQEKKPSVKFNYVTTEKKLYINAYIRFEGPAADDKFRSYKRSTDGTRYIVTSAGSSTYKDLVIKGIKQYWKIKITGNSYDFAKGVNFSTEVNVIESDDENQNVITIYIGEDRKYEPIDSYWYFSEGTLVIPGSTNTAEYDYSDNDNPFRIYMPTQEQFASNYPSGNGIVPLSGYVPTADSDNYANSAAHEFGHMLGLDDAYDSQYRKVKMTAELSSVDLQGKKAPDLMASGTARYASANDIEMALTAQGRAIRGAGKSWQSFVSYTYNGHKYVKSPAIRLN